MYRKFRIAGLLAIGVAASVASTAMAQSRAYEREDRYRYDERDDTRYQRESSERDRGRRSDRYERYDRFERDSDDLGTYIGVSAGSAIYDEEELPTLNPTIAVVRVGEKFNPNLAIEGRLGTGIRADESDGFKVNIDALYAGYVKGIIPFSSSFSAYGLAGVAGVHLHRNYPENDTSDAGLSFGFGIEFNLGGGASLNAEWVRLTTGTNDEIYDFTADQLTFGVNWRW